MHVKIKLMGTLQGQEPPEGRLELSEGASIADALDALGIERDAVQVFTVNGELVQRQDHVLLEGDELSVLPPVGGG